MRRSMIRPGIECVRDSACMNIRIGEIPDRVVVSLKVSKGQADTGGDRLNLAPPLRVRGTDPLSVWLGPDHWLILSRSQSSERLVGWCHNRLEGILHIAVDCSAAHAIMTLEGSGARALLASGSGVDFRPVHFPAGSCCRTRFAQISAVVIAVASNRFEILVDRSYAAWLSNWLSESMDVAGTL